jgi:hypothetical protein
MTEQPKHRRETPDQDTEEASRPTGAAAEENEAEQEDPDAGPASAPQPGDAP